MPHVFSLPLGDWSFEGPDGASWYPARVPGCVHTDLQRNGLIEDPFFGTNELELQWIERRDWRYRCCFELTAPDLKWEQLWLEFDGLDTLATVRLNGERLGVSENMFHAIRYEIGAVAVEGSNELEIVFANTIDYVKERDGWQPFLERNDPVGGRSRIRKAQYHYSWDWGPRFVTCGIWRPARVLGWDGARLADVSVKQRHFGGRVELLVMAELEGKGSGSLRARLELAGVEVARVEAGIGKVLQLEVATPELWWPAGQGGQPLYVVSVELLDGDGGIVDTRRKRIGLRTMELAREKDAEGESFYFRVNGRPVFAKGANWIPDHMFTTECDAERYRERLTAAVDANMNMLRVWGGGIYEEEAFYDICDELGLLVWQDFMFACALYPGNEDFCAILRPEAEYQVRRLRDRACLALWCGNNEIPFIDLYGDEMKRDASWAANYARVFHELLPQAVERFDGATPYWPSSPWTPAEYFADTNSGRAGDVHYWEVWHARAPVKSYEGLRVRFCSEFGMQSYASAETAKTFCTESERNVFSRVMENHQKNGGGNATMLHYMAKRYRYAEGYANLAYLSQLSQAYCMKVGVEHFRHLQPYTMGALYWQINDVWPVASWSSIEFGGRWKALHHEARRFFAPTLLYARADGEVEIGRYNAIREGIRGYRLFAVSDAPEIVRAELVWSLRDLDGALLGEESRLEVEVEPLLTREMGYAALAEGVDRSRSYLRAELRSSGRSLSRQNAFFTEPRFVELEDPRIEWEIEEGETEREYVVSLRSGSFAHAVELSFGALPAWYSDNWLDLHAGERTKVVCRFKDGVSIGRLRQEFGYNSLWHSYQAVR